MMNFLATQQQKQYMVSHEIIVLYFFRKCSLQMRMLSSPVRLEVYFSHCRSVNIVYFQTYV